MSLSLTANFLWRILSWIFLQGNPILKLYNLFKDCSPLPKFPALSSEILAAMQELLGWTRRWDNNRKRCSREHPSLRCIPSWSKKQMYYLPQFLDKGVKKTNQATTTKPQPLPPKKTNQNPPQTPHDFSSFMQMYFSISW